MEATVEKTLQEHHGRCVPALVRLRMLAGASGPQLPEPGLLVEMSLLMDEVRSELRKASRLVAGSSGQRKGPASTFLTCRDVRLETAAGSVTAAVAMQDPHALRRGLLRFDALATSTQKVQHELARPAKSGQARPRRVRPRLAGITGLSA